MIAQSIDWLDDHDTKTAIKVPNVIPPLAALVEFLITICLQV